MEVTFNLVVKSATGRAIFGATINKSIDLNRSISAGGFSSSNSVSGEGAYAALEREVALAAAKAVAFHFEPITAEEVNGARITLNYGAPFLDTGDIVQALSSDGRIVKFIVVGAVGGRSVAELDGRRGSANVAVGARVDYVDPASPAALGRRLERVDLP